MLIQSLLTGVVLILCIYFCSAKLFLFLPTSNTRGFAFVVFEDEVAVKKVLDQTDHALDGRAIDVKKAIPHAVHQVSKVSSASQ